MEHHDHQKTAALSAAARVTAAYLEKKTSSITEYKEATRKLREFAVCFCALENQPHVDDFATLAIAWMQRYPSEKENRGDGGLNHKLITDLIHELDKIMTSLRE